MSCAFTVPKSKHLSKWIEVVDISVRKNWFQAFQQEGVPIQLIETTLSVCCPELTRMLLHFLQACLQFLMQLDSYLTIFKSKLHQFTCMHVCICVHSMLHVHGWITSIPHSTFLSYHNAAWSCSQLAMPSAAEMLNMNTWIWPKSV